MEAVLYYQKLLSDEHPYVAQLFSACVFPRHKHCELEIIYCLEGQFSISLDMERFEVNPGEVIVIYPQCAHEADCQPNTHVLLIKIGPTLLGKRFGSVSHLKPSLPVFSPEKGGVRHLLEEIAEDCRAFDPISEMKVIGDLYKLCAALMEQYAASIHQDKHSRGKENRLEDVFQYIFLNYSSPFTVEAAARMSGYSVGNFCRRFKLETGKTFHAYLNDYRLQKARLLLEETSFSIESVSSAVGFMETKTFCRLFKRQTGITPTEYRNSQYTRSTVKHT